MSNLITVNFDTQTVSARDLHESLKIETPFKKWIDRMIEYGFEGGKDFWTKMSKSTGGRPAMEYDLSVDMAKQICMIQRTPEGKAVRQYLIDLEKAWNTPELVMARGLKAAQAMIEAKDVIIKEQKQIITEQKPKVIFADAVASSKTSILIGDLAKILKQNGFATGQKRLFELLRQDGYLIKSGSSKNMPTQKSMEMGLFEVKETSINNPDGSVRVTKTTKVTGKGQQYFINRYFG